MPKLDETALSAMVNRLTPDLLAKASAEAGSSGDAELQAAFGLLSLARSRGLRPEWPDLVRALDAAMLALKS